MTFKKYLVLFSLTVMLIFCGSENTDESMKVKKRTENVPLSDIKVPRTSEKILKITGIKFGSQIDIENDLTATPVLSDKEAVEEYNYRWYVNDGEVSGENSATLSREYFREDDWVYCRVQIFDEEGTFPEFVSKRVKIKGAVPVLTASKIDQFTVPGTFRYKINANMPETDDLEPDFGDEDEIDPEKALKFELISPLDKGIELDTQTGEITWNITKELVEELGNNITIKFSVISPSGRKVNSSISITLEKSEGDINNSDNSSNMGSEIE
ncbi:MAG: hypothetical protein ABFR36_01690 [Acidobacteriota bacterium]